MVRTPVQKYLSGEPNIILIDPLGYEEFIFDDEIVFNSYGLRRYTREAPFLGKPVLLMRDNTERPEAIKSGCELVGTATQNIVNAVEELINSRYKYNKCRSPLILMEMDIRQKK